MQLFFVIISPGRDSCNKALAVKTADEFKQQYKQHIDIISARYTEELKQVNNLMNQKIQSYPHLVQNVELKGKYTQRLVNLHNYVKPILNKRIEQFHLKINDAITTTWVYRKNSFEKDMKTLCVPILDSAHIIMRSLIKYHEMTAFRLVVDALHSKPVYPNAETIYFEPYVLPLQMDSVHKHIKEHKDKNVHESSLKFIVKNAKKEVVEHVNNELRKLNMLTLSDFHISHEIQKQIDNKAESMFHSLDLDHKKGTPSDDDILYTELLIIKFSNAVNELSVNFLINHSLPDNPFATTPESFRIKLEAIRDKIRDVVVHSERFDNVLKKAMEKKLPVS